MRKLAEFDSCASTDLDMAIPLSNRAETCQTLCKTSIISWISSASKNSTCMALVEEDLSCSQQHTTSQSIMCGMTHPNYEQTSVSMKVRLIRMAVNIFFWHRFGWKDYNFDHALREDLIDAKVNKELEKRAYAKSTEERRQGPAGFQNDMNLFGRPWGFNLEDINATPSVGTTAISMSTHPRTLLEGLLQTPIGIARRTSITRNIRVWIISNCRPRRFMKQWPGCRKKALVPFELRLLVWHIKQAEDTSLCAVVAVTIYSC
jgi:hypothetical protein